MDAKKTIRRAFAEARNKIPQEELDRAGEAVAAHLLKLLPTLRDVRVAALYFSRGSELPTMPAIEALRGRSVAIALPAWDGASYRFVSWDAAAPLEKGPMGIPQPSGGNILGADAIDLFLVPGLAFDRHGGRIGYGGGWYDRLLAGRRPDSSAFGLCLNEQLSEIPLPMEPHDILLDGVITPAGSVVRDHG